jgi:hypothetical protein
MVVAAGTVVAGVRRCVDAGGDGFRMADEIGDASAFNPNGRFRGHLRTRASTMGMTAQARGHRGSAGVELGGVELGCEGSDAYGQLAATGERGKEEGAHGEAHGGRW